MIIDVILDTCDLSPNQALVLHDLTTGRKSRVDATTTRSGALGQTSSSINVVLERWSLSLLPAPPAEPPELPGLYKQGIVLFRALFALLRSLPSYNLAKRLRSRTGGTGMGGLKVALRLASSNCAEEPLPEPRLAEQARTLKS